MTRRSLVVQHNQIVEARYRLSVGEQRLIKLLVSMIEPEDSDFKPYRISVVDLMRLLDISDNSFYRKIKTWSEQLIRNVLIFRGQGGEELQVAWLSSAEYLPKSGVVELEFSPKLKPFLLQLKSHFTAYELSNIIRLKHTYSIRIYELLKKHQRYINYEFTVERLRSILMLEEKEYQQFSDFRKRILKSAQEELAEKTDIRFSWEEKRIRQKCVAICFTIHPNSPKGDASVLEPLPAFTEPATSGTGGARAEGSEIQDSKIPKTPTEAAANDNPIVAKLTAMGVTPATAGDLAAHYDENRIMYGIAYTQDQQREGKVNNPAGFLVKAITEGYLNSQAEEEERKWQELALRDAEEMARNLKERDQRKREKEEKRAKEETVERFLAGLTPDQRQALEREFLAFYKDNDVIHKKYRECGMESPLVDGCFFSFVGDHRLS